ncbi:HAMP domain-containing protein [Pantoea sp. S62]|nr:HAMP domain-containing protein [Pantoea sp. S62]
MLNTGIIKMNIIKKVTGLKIGGKLGLGFTLVIMASVIISVLAFRCFLSIQENSAKRDITVQMLDTLAKARLNRTLFQYTRDKKFIDINGEAMNQLFDLRTSLDKYSWSVEGGGEAFSPGRDSEAVSGKTSGLS